MERKPLRIIQLSDMHLFGNPEKALLGVKTNESFKAVINLLKKLKNIDLIILSGDLSQDGSRQSYERMVELVEPLSAPIYYVPGNHDNPAVMQSVYPCARFIAEKQIILRDWQIILLDSQKNEAVEGYLDQSQLTFLQQCLKAYPNYYAVIFFHHQPVEMASDWLDKLGLTNKQAFWETIAHFPQVKAVFFGHIHQELETTMHGVPCYAVPSTCIQFKCKQAAFTLEELPPGYRLIELYDDGRINTQVERVPEYIGKFEAAAKGY